jgi:hypothetical protein
MDCEEKFPFVPEQNKWILYLVVMRRFRDVWVDRMEGESLYKVPCLGG